MSDDESTPGTPDGEAPPTSSTEAVGTSPSTPPVPLSDPGHSPSPATSAPSMPPAIGATGGRSGGRASMGAPSMFAGSVAPASPPRAAGAAPSAPTAATMPMPAEEEEEASEEMNEALERLQADNARLSQSLNQAVDMVRSIDEPSMPPVVGDGFVIDAGMVGDFVRIGRLLQSDGLIRSSHGSLAALSPSSAGLMHGTRDGCLLPRIGEKDLMTGRLGDGPPPGAGSDWRLHSVLLAHGALEFGSACATIAAHGPWTLAASLDPDAFVLDPLDGIDPGLAKVAIIEESAEDPDQVLRELKEAIDEGSGAALVVRGRVALALGRTFDEAARRLASLEQAMQLTMIARMAGYDA